MQDHEYTSKDYENEIGLLNKKISILELTIQVMILKSGLEVIALGNDDKAILAKNALEKARQYGLSMNV